MLTSLEQDVDYVCSGEKYESYSKRLVTLMTEKEWFITNYEGQYRIHKLGGKVTITMFNGAKIEISYKDFITKNFVLPIKSLQG